MDPNGYPWISYTVAGLYPDPISGDYLNAPVGIIQCFDDDCAGSAQGWVGASYGVELNSIAIGSDGTAYVVYDYYNTDPMGPYTFGLGIATCAGPGNCSTSQLTTLPMWEGYFIAAAVSMAPDKTPAIVYTEWTADSSTAYYLDPTDGIDTTISTDAGSDKPDLMFGSDGLPRILFPNFALSGTNFIQCANAACSMAAVKTISTGGDSVASGVVGADGNPLIEIGSSVSTGDSFMYVQCTAPDCSTYNAEPISGDWGNYATASMAVGPDLMPRMIAEDAGGTMWHIRALHGVPVNLVQTSWADRGNGDLHFEYSWESSTGNLADLSSCSFGEIVTYPGPDPFPFPSPPFPAILVPNPTKPDIPASLGAAVDDQKLPTTIFVTPYSVSSFTSTQYYRYKCPGDSGYTNLMGPNYIVRSVAQHPQNQQPNGGLWYFTVTKSGVSATIDPLP